MTKLWKNRIEGILFDMDGVLLDTEPVYKKAELAAARQMGYPITEDYLRQLAGMGLKEEEEKVGRDFPGTDPQAFFALAHKLVQETLEKDGPPLKPGVRETLEALQARGISMAVASSTNSSNVRKYMQRAGLAPYFGSMIGGDQVQNGKPAPDIFQLAAQGLGLAPASCAVVEDSYNGIRGAVAAGCLPVMIPDMLAPTGEIRELAVVFENMGDLTRFLDKF